MSYKLTICSCIFKGAIKFLARVHSYSNSSQTLLIPFCMVSFQMLILADQIFLVFYLVRRPIIMFAHLETLESNQHTYA